MGETIMTEYLRHPIFDIVSEVAAAQGVRAYVIGGYVRDCFLGRANNDIDIVVEGSGIELAQAVGQHISDHTHRPCNVSYFKNFGTAMLHHCGMEVEFVGARKESYRRESRKPIVENGTLEEDQRRRDFTINAMAFSLDKADFGALVDPFGGIRDLVAGIIRTPLEPSQTYSDDPLRMFRAIRFATTLSTPDHEFTIVPESVSAMKAMSSRIEILSKERIVEEMHKMLLADKPSRALLLMDEAGLLERVLPAVTKLKGVETIDGKGHKDNFSHSVQVVDNVAEGELLGIAEGRLKDYAPSDGGEGHEGTLRTKPCVWLRWAALLHDVGKAATKRFDPASGWTFHGHEVVGARMVPKIFQSLRMPLNEKMKYVQKLVGMHLRPIALVDDEVTDSAVRRLLFDAGDDIDDLMLLCNADITSKNVAKVARIRHNFELVREKLVQVEAKDAIRNFRNPIDGQYIMKVYGLSPGREIGILKEAVKDAILDGVIGNDFAEADAFMRRKAAEIGLKEVPGA